MLSANKLLYYIIFFPWVNKGIMQIR